jgi:transcriptional regulator with XRE-family HTH domain
MQTKKNTSDGKITERINSELNKKFGITAGRQSALASATGLTRTAISNYLSGSRFPDSYALLRLSRALGVSMEYILTGEGGNAVPSSADEWKTRALAAEQKLERITASMRGVLDQVAKDERRPFRQSGQGERAS